MYRNIVFIGLLTSEKYVECQGIFSLTRRVRPFLCAHNRGCRQETFTALFSYNTEIMVVGETIS